MPGHLLQDFTKQIRTVTEELSPAGNAAVPDLAQKFSAAAQYLHAARDDIQLNVLPPISADHAEAIEGLLRSVIELAKMDVVRSKLTAPVTGDDLIKDGSKLLGEASAYKYLATYFFSNTFVQSRDSRAFEEVVRASDTIVERANNLRNSTMNYLEQVSQAFERA